jgi:hypothetical protein
MPLTNTKSGIFKIWHGGRLPDPEMTLDVCDFFRRKKYNLWWGDLQIENSGVSPPEYVTNFIPVHDSIQHADSSVKDHPTLKFPIRAFYYSKRIWLDWVRGKPWHTPVVAVALDDNRKWTLIKGAKKITAARLLDIKEVPAIVQASENITLNGNFRRIKNDHHLYRNLAKMGTIDCDPEIGYQDFEISLGRESDAVKLTGIHWLFTNSRSDLGDQDWQTLWDLDCETWHNQAQIVADAYPRKRPHSLFEFKLDENLSNLDIDQIKHNWPPGASAVVKSNDNPRVCWRLIESSVFFGRDINGDPVGAVWDRERNIGIIYNNGSDIVLPMPAGVCRCY